MLDVSPEDLEAIVITHHHGDHGGGALIAQKRWKVPVYANHRTNAELGLLPELTRPFEALDVLPFNNGISLLPVPVPHSGADNVAFVQAMEESVLQSSRIWVVGQMSWCIMSGVANTSQSKQTMTETD